MSIISQRSGWYLFEVHASHEIYDELLIIDSGSMINYGLIAGSEVLLEGKKRFDTFIIWPFIEQRVSDEALEQLMNHYENLTGYKTINPDYLRNVDKLNEALMDKGFEFKERMGYKKVIGSLAAPVDWLIKNDKTLGDTVLLRDDCPDPVICNKFS